jgi:hypothetical protein
MHLLHKIVLTLLCSTDFVVAIMLRELVWLSGTMQSGGIGAEQSLGCKLDQNQGGLSVFYRNTWHCIHCSWLLEWHQRNGHIITLIAC